MANYERVNWENSPSVETPVNADNLNIMDEWIASLSDEINDLKDTDVGGLQDAIRILTARLNTLVAVPSHATDGNAELIDIRVATDGTIYSNAGAAIRTQLTSILDRLDALEARSGE